MVLATNLGFPRIGAKRELKKALESFWKGETSKEDLLKTGTELRARHWQLQKAAGLSHIPCNDFSYYDHMLDMCTLLGVVPERYEWDGGMVSLETFFSMARGNAKVGAMEMTKWFDTNYHYIVPELEEGQAFKLSSTKIFDEFAEAKAQSIPARPVLVGPITFLKMAKKKTGQDFCRCTLVLGAVQVYIEVLKKLESMGAEWVQMDEPCLALDLEDRYRDAMKTAYKMIATAVPNLKIMLTTYFDGLRDNMDTALGLPVAGLHLDLRRAPAQLEEALKNFPADKILSVGVVDGRNIWRNDLRTSIETVKKAVAKLGSDRVFVAPSCAMLHSPIDLDNEKKLDAELKGWLAFAKQKLAEIAAITKAVNEGESAIKDILAASDAAAASRKASPRIHNNAVKTRTADIKPAMFERASPFSKRKGVQHAALKLPDFPTTTIGSFPQTTEIREARAANKSGTLSDADYEAAMKKEIELVVRYQEEADIDVLVHGEAERNDMVEYFGEQLSGFAFTQNGWVQSYGSRYVKPPIIFGDVSRPTPMTVKWSSFAQSLTKRPMKGMLTGPITILCWSFVRDDQPRETTAKQIGLAIRDEVADLEKAGITVIQIDEPAVREGLPLRRADWQAYLRWAVDSFRLSAACVKDTTQIHTHMCYAEFNDIIGSIGEMDADVISIETSRSQMELLEAFVTYKYPNEIGPGVYDIHSPRVPPTEEMDALLDKAVKVLNVDQIWVNPDCGLKTRGWKETKAALENMVECAKRARAKYARKAA
ncbi:MAG: 5-methyltetrahydropteroyltriglutamate--homocysteine S-methyltransferase [Alphaproteobacteria bacterium]|nr:5-methyltetrahydropteroyltriglutamate--homocysteine S-methyltransferase [Alphaproteobacteria bacterium]